MTVRIRLFAALREAAGTSETTGPPGSLDRLLGDLEHRYGETFTSRLEAASVLVDGQHVDRRSDAEVSDGAEVALLPPFSGGGTEGSDEGGRDADPTASGARRDGG